MIDWYYIWSPKYEIFHRVLYEQLTDISGINVHPIFANQELFNRRSGTEEKHFFTGNGTKNYALIKILEENIGKHIIFSDVDIIPFKKNIPHVFEEYKINDVTYMRDNFSSEIANIGCMLIKSNMVTIELFKNVLNKIHKENVLDQDAFNEELKVFSGKYGFFSDASFLQSNMLSENDEQEKYVVIQCLCSPIDTTGGFAEKIVTLSHYVDITHLKYLLSNEIIEELKEYAREYESESYINNW